MLVLGILLIWVGWMTGCSPAVKQAVGGGAGAPTHGIVIGEVTSRAATVWVRCAAVVPVRVEVSSAAGAARFEGRTDAGRDFTARVRVRGLVPESEYEVAVRCGDGLPAAGRFTTAPLAEQRRPVRFAWGGDVGGQNVCRDAVLGYPIFAVIAAQRPDFFVGLGDMVYADDECREIGRHHNRQLPGPPPGLTTDAYRALWRYNRGDPHPQNLLATAPYFPVWDDHEIRNDAGPHDDSPASGGGTRLMPPAAEAFVDYQPWRDRGDRRFYHSVRWGRHIELFLLDTRTYRDRNDQPDTAIEPKTMLGKRQRDWLLEGVATSDATWKVIVSSVPLSIPTGPGPQARDGWSDDGGTTGFEREAALLLDGLRAAATAGVIFITTDVHFATAFEYQPFADAPEFIVREFVTGPLNAGVFPRRDLDPTFSPRRLFFWGPDAEPITSFDDALRWFNYGQIDIDAGGHMTVTVTNARGETVWQTTMSPSESGQAAARPFK